MKAIDLEENLDPLDEKPWLVDKPKFSPSEHLRCRGSQPGAALVGFEALRLKRWIFIHPRSAGIV